MTVMVLVVLDSVLASNQATGNVSAAENGAVKLLRTFLDPTSPTFKFTPSTNSLGSTTPTVTLTSSSTPTSSPSTSQQEYLA